MKLIQDYNSQDKTNTIQFSVDVLNVSKLIEFWLGISKYQQVYSLLVFLLIKTNIPTYTFNGTQTKRLIWR
jgi:hypothetical protein